jgi:prophage regulatory protein
MNVSKFYRLREIIGDRKQGIHGIVPVSRAAWYAGIKEGRYPKPVKLSERSAAWRASDIEVLVERLNNGCWNSHVEEQGRCGIKKSCDGCGGYGGCCHE